MSARAALGAALRDFYAQSWRLLALNATLSALVLAAAAAAYVDLRAGFALLLLAGPAAAALMHCAVTLARTEELRLAEAFGGLRLHWRRGLGLGTAGGALCALGGYAIVFYARAHAHLWPLAFLALYVLLLLVLYQLLLWAVAFAEPETPLRLAAAEALELLVRAPRASLGLGLALLLVNLAGIALAVMPFLTLTVAYSFLAAAHFALPSIPEVAT